MKVTRNKRGYAIHCTDLEFEILGVAVDQIESGEPYTFLDGKDIRRVFNMRTRGGLFLRVDEDRRPAPLSRAMRYSIDTMLACRGLRVGGTTNERRGMAGKPT